MKNIKDFEVKNKKVLVRCDFNVPIDDAGNILDDFRIVQTLPTIQYLISENAKIILMSHLGEPEGVASLSLTLDKVKKRLEELLGMEITKTSDCIGGEVQAEVAKLKPGEILLLENVRFHKEETDLPAPAGANAGGQAGDNLEFAKQLAALGEIYINDAFGDCHRAHASMVAVPQFLPHGAGLLLQKEIANLSKILENPQKPLVALVGGAKVGTKVKFISHILILADTVIVGGLIQKEITEEKLEFSHPEKILAPVGDLQSMDIDAQSIKIFCEKILQAKTVVWNGPFGKFEEAEYKNGTLQIAKAIIESGAYSVAGGGETIEFLHKEGMIDKFSHVSTGGGAMLNYLAGDELPALKALEE